MSVRGLSRCVGIILATTLCLLGGVWAKAQGAPPDVRFVSRTPSVVITFAVQDGPTYKIRLNNRTKRAVTAFALRVVPAGTEEVNGASDCRGRCLLRSQMGNAARPAISADDSVELPFSIDAVSGGTIIFSAAVFNDQTYEGEERAAAFLVARQIGQQAEYDRIVPAVISIMSSREDDRAKATRIQSSLSEVSVSLTPAMVKSFRSSFPDLAGCDRNYARAMKRAAVAEKKYVTEQVQQFIAGKSPQGTSLTRWWQWTADHLNTLGCSGCWLPAVYAQPARAVVRVDCRTEGGDTFEINADDLFADEALDQEAELGPEDGFGDRADIAAKTPVVSGATGGAAEILPLGAAPAAKIEPAPAPSMPAHPRVYAFPNVAGYSALFSIISDPPNSPPGYDNRWLQKQEFSRAGLTDEQGAVVLRAARPVAEAKEKLFAVVGAFKEKWGSDSPLFPHPLEWRRMEAQQYKITAASVRRLRKELGEAAFRKLDEYVGDHWTSPQGVFRFPSTTSYRFYFYYVANLERLAERESAEERRRASLPVRSQRAAGLNNKQWAALVKLAKAYEYDPAAKPHEEVEGLQPSTPRAEMPVQAASGLQTPAPGTGMPVQAASGSAIGALAPTSAARRFVVDEKVTADYIRRLKLKLGVTAFRRLDSYVDRAYNPWSPATHRAEAP